MTYFETIRNLTKNITSELVDFSQPRDIARTPTQASSNFITNKEQGDWAERLILNAINESSRNYVAVKYGKSDDLVAGEVGFDQFFQEFQDELDSIGKRPDILIFNQQDFIDNLGYDISHVPHGDIGEYVKKAVAGIEVRSSAFLIDHYEEYMQQQTLKFTNLAISIKDEILHDYSFLLNTPARKKSDAKNQNKTTIKIKSNEGIEIASKVDEPSHKSVRKEMERSRLLFYVTFNGGCAYLNAENLKSLLNLKNDF